MKSVLERDLLFTLQSDEESAQNAVVMLNDLRRG
jgi:hypothetical protein